MTPRVGGAPTKAAAEAEKKARELETRATYANEDFPGNTLIFHVS